MLVHARALVSSAPQGATVYVEQDLTEPHRILKVAALTGDFSAPVAVVILATTQFIVDTEEAHAGSLVSDDQRCVYRMARHIHGWLNMRSEAVLRCSEYAPVGCDDMSSRASQSTEIGWIKWRQVARNR